MPATDIDRHIGARLRQRRTVQGLSQTTLGAGADITFQQVQKYEKGTNCISVATLHNFAQQLDVPLAYFLEGMPRAAAKKARLPAVASDDPLAKRDVLEMVKLYAKLPPKKRAAVRGFLGDMLRL